MRVKAWKAATYGIRVGNRNAREHFDQNWEYIEVEIDGQFYRFNLSPTFWATCPEFMGGPISNWLQSQGLIPWPKGNPPEFELTPLGGYRFRLRNR
ncbi:MAG TPA: hypothetical protein HA348_07585 [Thermoplasmata archaeon]|nr:hypothetical protein [Thermoplasmata archaeon]